jgi:hypothetical protein
MLNVSSDPSGNIILSMGASVLVRYHSTIGFLTVGDF